MKFVTKTGRNLALAGAAALTALTWGADASATYFVQLATNNEAGITNNGTCNLSDAIDCVKGGATGTANGATCTAAHGYHGCGGPPADQYVFLNDTSAPTYLIGSTQVIPAGVSLFIIGGDLPGDAFIKMTGTGDAFSIASGATFSTSSLTILHNTATAGRGVTNSGTCFIGYTGVADGKVTGTCDATHSSGCGGGIYNNGSLDIYNSLVYHNSATKGGGIYNTAGASALSIDATTIGGDHYYTDSSGFRGNTATSDGGGLYNIDGVSVSSATIITRSVISDNVSGGVGGGIASYGILGATIQNDTISGNKATSGGGLHSGGRAEITNSTVSGNTATSGGGGGIKVVTGDNNYLDLFYSTIAFNHSQTAGGGVDLSGAVGTGGNPVRTQTDHSIVAQNTFGASNTALDYKGDPQSDVVTRSLFGVTDGILNFQRGVNLVGNPQLAPLAANGYTQQPLLKTHAIPSTSLAHDQVSNGAPFNQGSDADERGFGRDCVNPGGLCDLGAFERQPSDP